MHILSVNEALDAGSDRHHQCFEIEGLLTYEFENISLNHWPKAEQRKDGRASSIWLADEGAFVFDDDVMRKWSGKRIVVLGIFEVAPLPRLDGLNPGFGHFGLWPAQIKARRIDLLKRRRREQTEMPEVE